MVSSKELLHPLLGSKVELPAKDAVVDFKNIISLKTHEYIGDHKVGQFSIMPASGYIEMSLAAAITQQNSKFPLSIKMMKIKSPLQVEDKTSQEIYTVMNKENVEIYSKDGDTWQLHADCGIDFKPDLNTNLKSFLELQKDSKYWKVGYENLYQKLASLGYNFGKLFESLFEIKTKDNNELFAKIRIPPLESTGINFVFL
jgi:acyl transferase domain-containing protein